MKHQIAVPIGDETLHVTTGQIAKQADGSCTIQMGDTVVLTTACMRADDGTPRGFLPLTVDYRENTYAQGRIPGGFFKREGRPSEKEIITCRQIDRPLRPLFPEGYFNETQVISYVLSADGENDPDVLAINGASAALRLSNIPFFHTIGAVRVGMVDGEIIFNPTTGDRDVSDLDLMVVATKDAVVMVEAAINELSEDVVLDCIFKAHEEIQKIITALDELAETVGVTKPEWETPEAYPTELYDKVKADLWDSLNEALHTPEKFERSDAVKAVVKGYLDSFGDDQDEQKGLVKKIVSVLSEELLCVAVLEKKIRFDGRALDKVRDIDIEVGVLPRTHGSALFTRGETQALAVTTLGTRRDAQIIESYEGETLQKFLLHYSFPPFSVGEVKFLRGPSRREIGHGVLARRALTPMLPHEDDFPYTIRLNSDIMESNGSSSMASVCGGSLALFDAGVPMRAPVAGVAMGLIKRGDAFAIMTDIAGQEDHYGDMDFKVAGTRDGLTALQMDIKITGVTKEIMGLALVQAQAGRFFLLDQMEAIIEAPRQDMSDWAPRLHKIQIDPDKIRDIIGPGGKTIRSIVEETGCDIDVDNDGTVTVASPDGTSASRAIKIIERLTEVAEIGNVYNGTVRRVEPYGAFVEILPGTDGLVHISELAPYRVGEVTDILQLGDELEVKVIDIDDRGKVRLSRKAVIMDDPNYDPSDYEGMGAPADDDRGGRGGDRGGRGGYDRGGRGGDRGGRGDDRGGRGGDRGGRGDDRGGRGGDRDRGGRGGDRPRSSDRGGDRGPRRDDRGGSGGDSRGGDRGGRGGGDRGPRGGSDRGGRGGDRGGRGGRY